MRLFKGKKKETPINPDDYSLNDVGISNTAITRMVIKDMGASGVTGLDKDLLIEKLLYFYDNKTPIPQRIEILANTFNTDKKTAETIEKVQFAKISLISDYLINKDRGATKFNIVGKNRTLKKNININEFPNYVGFIIDNNACPTFHRN